MTSRALLVLTTCGNPEEARRIAAELVETQLAACVNTVGPIESTYRWQGRVEQAQESLLLIKTTEAQMAAVERLIRERSSYELPEVLALAVAGGSPDYLTWLASAVGNNR